MLKQLVVVVLALVVAGVFSHAPSVSKAESVDEIMSWKCGQFEWQERKGARVYEPKWSRANDVICERVCGEYPFYKGNWAIFEATGLQCCCTMVKWMREDNGVGSYGPFVSAPLAKRLNISARTPLED